MSLCLAAGLRLAVAAASAAQAGLLDDLGINFKVWGVQVLVFIVTFVVLSRVLFGRIVSHLQRREDDIRKQGEAIARERADIERLSKEYGDYVARVEKEAYDRMQAVLREGLEAGHRILARAQEEARAQIEAARTAIAEERTAAGEQLRGQIERLTAEACARIVNMPMDPSEVRSSVLAALAPVSGGERR